MNFRIIQCSQWIWYSHSCVINLDSLCLVPSYWEEASKSLEFPQWYDCLCYLWWDLIVYANEVIWGPLDSLSEGPWVAKLPLVEKNCSKTWLYNVSVCLIVSWQRSFENLLNILKLSPSSWCHLQLRPVFSPVFISWPVLKTSWPQTLGSAPKHSALTRILNINVKSKTSTCFPNSKP